MKYKIGDKVKIKTWKEMEKEFGAVSMENISGDIIINCKIGITYYEERQFSELCPDRIIKITKLEKDGLMGHGMMT